MRATQPTNSSMGVLCNALSRQKRFTAAKRTSGGERNEGGGNEIRIIAV